MDEFLELAGKEYEEPSLVVLPILRIVKPDTLANEIIVVSPIWIKKP